MSSNTGAAYIIIFFSISLLFTSVVVSWMLFNAYGIESVSPINLQNFESDSVIDFKTSDGSGDNNLMLLSGNWPYTEGIGRTSDSYDSYLLFNNAGAANAGAHTNTYRINNSNQLDYSIVLSYSSVRVQEVIVSGDGFHVVDGLPSDLFADWFNNEVFFYPYPNANQLTDVEIKTVFNPALGSGAIDTGDSINVLDFYLNGQILFTFDGSVGSQMEPIVKAYYGGVGSKNNIGLTIESFNTVARPSAQNVLDIAQMGISYISTILSMVLWNIPAQYFPWELNLLLIKSQAFCVGVGVWFWIRG